MGSTEDFSNEVSTHHPNTEVGVLFRASGMEACGTAQAELL